MSERVSDKDYTTLENFIKAMLQRHHDGKIETADAAEKVMHTLTALIDDGVTSQEGFPYMKMMVSQWGNEAAKKN
jgi:hypothetical protein